MPRSAAYIAALVAVLALLAVVAAAPVGDAVERLQCQGTLEGLVAGEWRPLHVHDSGCKWHGPA